ncbi:MAG: hypothetical protein LC796_00730 [Acidobacteria bacterium]|nr:hypothetical protein [Acidobacteriota bacterium]MCA1612088.1 hypothetical protein [Acidobacteriota bacterium]
MKRAKEPASLGFESHSGWAVLVAVGGSRREPAVVLRERVVLVAAGPGDGRAKQPFHAAEAMPFPRARAFLEAAADDVGRRARSEMDRLLAALSARGFEPVSCAILSASSRELPDLEAILASHALIHAAEGDFFRDAIAKAAKASGLAVTRIRRKELADYASQAIGLPAAELERRVALFRKSVGAPWGSDQKLAALAAWSVL